MAYNFFNKLKQTSGFTMTEVMVGSGLLLGAVLVAMTATGQLNKVTNTNEVSSLADSRIIEIIENIRQQPTTQIIQYSLDPSSLLKSTDLKMAWSLKTEMSADLCQDCPGRYGYVITPFSSSLSDLYLVTVLFTYNEWSEPRKYEFLVSK